MNPINYLYFTLMSVIIQFCLMDFTTEKIKISNISMDTNSTGAKKIVNEVFKKLNQTPHALYYQNDIFGLSKNTNISYENNATIVTESSAFQTPLSTTFELLYDENVTILDNDFTTESFMSSTEFDNVTEISFSNKVSTEKPMDKPKPKSADKCYCNLLHQICDLNCCCDVDCTINEVQLFKRINESICNEKSGPSYSVHTCDGIKSSNAFENLFCFAKINLPQKKTITKIDPSETNNRFKWHEIKNLKVANTKYIQNEYNSNNLVWLLNNGSLDTIDIPIPLLNNYCSGEIPVRFLQNEDIKCYVKLSEIHILRIVSRLHESSAVTFNNVDSNTIVNCSSLQCIKWTIIVCDDDICDIYDKSRHDPRCAEGYCSNIALQIDYLFYCNESGLVNATLKLTVQKVSLMTQYVTQKICVRFYMTNDTISNKIELSGNPGYLRGLPVIASFARSNHSSIFYNTSIGSHKKYLLLPLNRDGECVISNFTHNKISFGQNIRSKCRLSLSQRKFTQNNGTDSCLSIQMQIVNFLKLNDDLFIAPYGNPQYARNDTDWILLSKLENSNIFGEYSAKEKLMCFGITSKFSYVFVYADISENSIANNKIVDAKVELLATNMTVNIRESISTVITIDVNFMDASKPLDHVYAGAPHLKINLPANFFLPFY